MQTPARYEPPEDLSQYLFTASMSAAMALRTMPFISGTMSRAGRVRGVASMTIVRSVFPSRALAT